MFGSNQNAVSLKMQKIDDNSEIWRILSEQRNRLLAVAVSLCDSRDDAEDLVSRTIERACGRYSTFQERSSLFYWMRRIMVNIAADDARDKVLRNTMPTSPDEMAEDELLSTNRSEEEILASSDNEALRAAISRLEPEYKKTVVMHYMMDMPLKEIAKVLHRPIGTVKWRLSVAKDVLAKMLARTLGRPGTWIFLALGLITGCVATYLVMRLPPRKPADPVGGIAYNTPKVHEIAVRRAPKEVKIDGDLSEWTPPVFEAACNPPYDRDYRALIRMMWDEKRLYIAGDIRTPDPMHNRSSALGTHHFAGGSVICRLAATDGLGWPLPSSSYYWTYKLPSAEYPDENLVSLVMYHDAATDSEKFYAHRRMCSQQILDVPSGSWRGAYREHADKRGYTFEYAIVWKAADITPPAPGEVRANTWNIHFSDAEGVFCTGQISENFVKEISKGYGRLPLQLRCYFPPLWGRVVFE